MGAKTVFLLSVLVGASSGFLIKVPVVAPVINIETKPEVGWLQLQKLINSLFEDVCEVSSDPTVVKLASEFNLAAEGPNFTNQSVLDNLKNLQTKGFLPKGRIFTEYDIDQLKEVQVIYEVLYNAVDINAFFKTAAWLRQNINCGVFVDAVYAAILKRKDTQHLTIPAPYELLPNYFLRRDVIFKAVALLNNGVTEVNVDDCIRNEGNSYIIQANYTSEYHNDDESVLAYFREDVGLNTFNFLRQLKYAPWFNNPADVNNKFGEFLYFSMKQLAVRYDLERYSNGLPNVENIDWTYINTDTYDPLLVYSNGENFRARKGIVDTADSYYVNEDMSILSDIEDNIETYVTHVVQYVQDKSAYSKTQILNYLLEILVTKANSYDVVARRVLDKNIEKLASLDHYVTSLRDPVFWQLNKNIVNLVEWSLQAIPGYTKKQLYFPGVEVLNVDVKKIMTTFDKYDFDVTDALKTNNTKSIFRVRIEQPRLSHKPFTVKITISSLVKQKGLVKIFLGPKTLPGEFSKSKNSFMLLDCFETAFKLGSNVISRSSADMKHLANDYESFHTLRKKLTDAEFGLNVSPLNIVKDQVGFPSRLILPKGSEEGLPFQLFVFVVPSTSTSNNLLYPVVLNSNDAFSPGYPLDLSISDADLVTLPNSFIKDIIIVHKDESKSSNAGAAGENYQWNTKDDGYTSSYQPERTFGQAKSFDYKSKKGQFDYKSKKTQYEKPVTVVIPPVDVSVENVYDHNVNTYKEVSDSEAFPNNIKEFAVDLDFISLNNLLEHSLLGSKKNDAKTKLPKIKEKIDSSSEEHDLKNFDKNYENADEEISKEIKEPSNNTKVKNVIKTIDKAITNKIVEKHVGNDNLDENYAKSVNNVHKNVDIKFFDSNDPNQILRKDIDKTIFNRVPNSNVYNSDETLSVPHEDKNTRIFIQEDDVVNTDDYINDDVDDDNEDSKVRPRSKIRCVTVYDFIIGNCFSEEKVYE